MNQLIYVGFDILELSKLDMYDFHCNYIKKIYEDQETLLFTDEDSPYYHIQTNNNSHDVGDNKTLQ